nr:metallophosphoesterase family protein [Tissierella sp.]
MRIKELEKDKALINSIKEVKLRIDEGSYIKGEDLEFDFKASLEEVWGELNHLDEDDMTDFVKLNNFLIEEVTNLHQRENNLVNKKLMKTNIDIKMINNRLEDSKRAFDIYAFNDQMSEYFLIGDIHSDLISVDRILEKTDFFEKMVKDKGLKLIFIGDYVDRGASHLKLLQGILTLKYLFPEHIFLQKGNHDLGTYTDGVVKMGVKKPEKDSEDDWFLLYLYNLTKANTTFPDNMIYSYLKFFNSLAIASFISVKETTLLVAHAGIPRPKGKEGNLFDHIESLSDLTNETIKDHIDRSIVENIIWSDPTDVNEDLKEERARFKFTQAQFEEFKDLLGFDYFIRGHQVETQGYRKFFKERLLTIFSSGRILKDGEDINTDTAYSKVNPHIAKFVDGEIILVALND